MHSVRSTGCGVWTGIEGIDIYRTANIFVKRHAEAAAFHLAMRADEALRAGDPFPLGGRLCHALRTRVLDIALELD